MQDDNFKFTENNLRSLVGKIFADRDTKIIPKEDVTLINHNAPDRQVITALLHRYSNKSFKDCYTLAEQLINNGKALDLVKNSLKYISEFDKVPRAFETGFLIYEVVMSASCFAQLKRHRMNTLLSQDYNPELGYTIPPNIEEIGLLRELKDICTKTDDLYYDFNKKHGKAAEYCLTNAHRRRVIVAINLRQLYHISRIREDEHSQWEIRDKAKKMSQLAKKTAPITTMFLAGKDEFKNVHREVTKK